MTDFTGYTIRIKASTMKGQAKDKGNRTAVCLGWAEGLGWTVVTTTSGWVAPWQQDIRQTGNGWSGWDLRYRKPIAWTPNMAIYLSSEEMEQVIAADGRVGHAPLDVINHGIDELEHAIDNGLMGRRAWFNQAGLSRR